MRHTPGTQGQGRVAWRATDGRGSGVESASVNGMPVAPSVGMTMNSWDGLSPQELRALQRDVTVMKTRFRLLLGSGVVSMLLGAVFWAPVALSEPATPNTTIHNDLYQFDVNTPAYAAEVNSNFATLHDLVDVNAVAIGANHTAITALGTSAVHGSRINNGTITANKLVPDAVNSQVRAYLRNNCRIWIGWRDRCNNCTDSPAVWANIRVSGGGRGCGGHGERVCAPRNSDWVGVGTEGVVNGDDTFYVAFTCS